MESRTPPASLDRCYFSGYDDISIHKEMIEDNVRTEAYKTAIMHHQQFIAGKVVLDVGCGTGILSIFCARAGAKRVYAVDASDIALQARRIVEANKLSHIITVLHTRVEDVQLDEEVDVIISEWMGYMLLQESMLESVIIARDRWLKLGGLILPSSATLYMAPYTHSERYRDIDFWNNVHDIDMSALIPLAKVHAFEEPRVDTIDIENVLDCPHKVKHIDIGSITIPEVESITTTFRFDSNKSAPLHGFAFWFEVQFTGEASSHLPTRQFPAAGSQRGTEALLLSTSPKDPPTHWKQTLLYCYDVMNLEKDEHVEGSVTLSKNDLNGRSINICLKYGSGGQSFERVAVF